MSRRSRTTSMHYVYRCFDATGRLIYVGSTVDLFGRLRNHELTSWWSPTVAKVTAKVYPDGPTARTEERRIMRAENPRWNLQGRWAKVRNGADTNDVIDYRTAYVNYGNAEMVWGRKHLANIDAELARRRQERAA